MISGEVRKIVPVKVHIMYICVCSVFAFNKTHKLFLLRVIQLFFVGAQSRFRFSLWSQRDVIKKMELMMRCAVTIWVESRQMLMRTNWIVVRSAVFAAESRYRGINAKYVHQASTTASELTINQPPVNQTNIQQQKKMDIWPKSLYLILRSHSYCQSPALCLQRDDVPMTSRVHLKVTKRMTVHVTRPTVGDRRLSIV